MAARNRIVEATFVHKMYVDLEKIYIYGHNIPLVKPIKIFLNVHFCNKMLSIGWFSGK